MSRYGKTSRKGNGRSGKRYQTMTKPEDPQPFLDQGTDNPTGESQAYRRRVCRVTRIVARQIRATIGARPPEQGGMLGRDPTGTITHFHFDQSAHRTGATYSPDTTTINQLLATNWNPANIRLAGFVHSHYQTMPAPSGGDRAYAKKILDANPDMEELLLPIVVTDPDRDGYELRPYAAVRAKDGVQVQEVEFMFVDETVAPTVALPRRREIQVQPIQSPLFVLSRAVAGLLADLPLRVLGQMLAVAGERLFKTETSEEHQPCNRSTIDATFVRVRNAYDLDLLARCRVIAIGIGGAAGFCEDLARAGVGQFVLIDPDQVSQSNLATQQVYRRDIGRLKVECVAERIKDINPSALVATHACVLDDIDDKEFSGLASGPLENQSPDKTLLCGLTDNFFAQARVNRLALQFGLPSLCAQVYQEGRGAEITFTYPGVTPACHRCVLSSRYKEYLEQGYQNQVTSHGTPVFATTRLNSLKGFIAMAILHHGAAHPRWGQLLGRTSNRNLVQLRLDPDLGSTLGLGVFDRVLKGADQDRLLFDETIWLPQKPDCPENGFPTCPDCGGTGDLRQAIGKFKDTRVMAG